MTKGEGIRMPIGPSGRCRRAGAKSASGTEYKYLYTHLIGSAREDRPTGC